MPIRRIPIHIVFYQEAGEWVAHCLQFDLVGTGPDKRTAVTMLRAVSRIRNAG